MPPFLPVLSLSRSQNVRLGKGPGNAVPPSVNFANAAGLNPQSGAVQVPFFADLALPEIRRDLQHHTSLGAVIAVGPASRTVSSDFYRVSGLATTAGTGTTVNVASGVIRSRTYGLSVNVAGATGLAIAASDPVLDRTDLVIVSNTGVVSVVTGTPATAGSSVAPVAPANTTPVATVLVPAAASASTGYTLAAAYPTA